MAVSSPPTLRAAFASDRLLLGATLLLGLFTCAPVAVTPWLPLHDLPGHVGSAALMKDVLQGGTVAAEHYRVQALPSLIGSSTRSSR